MTWELVLGYVKALIWPLVVLVMGFIFRSQLANMFNRIESLETPVGSATFQKQAEAIGQELTEELSDLVFSLDAESEAVDPPIEERGTGFGEFQENSEPGYGTGIGSPETSSAEPRLTVETPSRGSLDRDFPISDPRRGRNSNDVFTPLYNLALADPTGAVLGSWREIERALDEAQRDLFLDRSRGTSKALGWLANQGVLPVQVVRSAQDLRELRNRVVHEGEIQVSADGARTYVQSARRFIDALTLARTPSMKARSYEAAVQRALSRSASQVTSNFSDFDFLVEDHAGKSAIVQCKYRSRSPLSINDVQQEVSSVIHRGVPGGILIVTNTGLSEKIRSLNAGDGLVWSDGRPLEVVTWAGPEDDGIIVRALGRVAISGE